jgi:hypothetical protein
MPQSHTGVHIFSVTCWRRPVVPRSQGKENLTLNKKIKIQQSTVIQFTFQASQRYDAMEKTDDLIFFPFIISQHW